MIISIPYYYLYFGFKWSSVRILNSILWSKQNSFADFHLASLIVQVFTEFNHCLVFLFGFAGGAQAFILSGLTDYHGFGGRIYGSDGTIEFTVSEMKIMSFDSTGWVTHRPDGDFEIYGAEDCDLYSDEIFWEIVKDYPTETMEDYECWLRLDPEHKEMIEAFSPYIKEADYE